MAECNIQHINARSGTMLKGKEFWNRIAQDYSRDRTLSRKLVLDPELYGLARNAKGKRVLDVACGTGRISTHLAEAGAIVTGIDYSEEMIKIAKAEAKKKKLKIDFITMDARRLGALEGGFDLAISALLLPHLPSLPDISRVLNEINGLLKTNAAGQSRLVIAEPHPSFDVYMRNRLTSGDFDYFAHGLEYTFEMRIGGKSLKSRAYHWTLEDYCSSIAKAGFAIRSILEPEPKPALKRTNPEYYAYAKEYPRYMIFDCAKSDHN
jgi:ubiquinone/menaquinone biosynthesis C-methylase UbiE